MPNTVPAAGEAMPKNKWASLPEDFHPSDIVYEVSDLLKLLQASYNILHEMHYAHADGSRNEELDQVASIQRIAIEHTKRIDAKTFVLDGPCTWFVDDRITTEAPAASVTAASLTTAILRHKADWNLFLAMSSAADDAGVRNAVLPTDHVRSGEVIANWNTPAADLGEAEMALELAIADYEAGDTPRIRAMMKAAFGFLRAERERRAAQ
ncbi:hypothetical protein [Rhizobium sp. Leaf386]|uniref:hypothetical protein n=1 Tax=Rhizobium sp. Leaf386 TaxID=1736359 RepID=UPI0007126079|nr:hypothetical protein [Rhizobium sp. Leaf386]KQS84150.1 hypothetical protein ASG50_30140 [Rhizobium sp. Leaf386]